MIRLAALLLLLNTAVAADGIETQQALNVEWQAEATKAEKAAQEAAEAESAVDKQLSDAQKALADLKARYADENQNPERTEVLSSMRELSNDIQIVQTERGRLQARREEADVALSTAVTATAEAKVMRMALP